MRRFTPLLAVALLAACGGGGSRLSHAEFVTKANAICKSYDQRIAALGRPNSLDQLAQISDRAVSIAKDEIGKFKKLRPPKADEPGAAAFARQGDKLVARVEQVKQAASKGDAAAVQRLGAQAQIDSARSRTIAQRLGLTECARS